MKSFLDLLESFDTVAPEIGFSYRKKTRMQSPLGGAIVVFIYTVISLGFVYFSRDIVFKTNPITKANKTFRQELESPANNFPLSFLLTDSGISPIMPGSDLWNSIEVIPEYWVIKVANSRIDIKAYTYRTMPCTKEYYSNYIESFESAHNQASICIDYSKAYDRAGNPVEEEPLFRQTNLNSSGSYFTLRIKQCDESKKPGCSKPLLAEGQLQVYFAYPDAVVDFDNYDKPVFNSLTTLHAQLSAGIYTRKFLLFSVNEFVSDDGLILTESNSESYVQTQIDDTAVVSYSEATRNLYAFTFKLSLVKETLERRYIKVQEILANVGGFAKVIVLFASLVVKHFSQFCFFRRLGSDINLLNSKLKPRAAVDNLVVKDQSNLEAISPKKTKIQVEIGFFRFLTRSICSKHSDILVQKDKVFKYLDLGFLTSRIIEFEAKLDNIG